MGHLDGQATGEARELFGDIEADVKFVTFSVDTKDALYKNLKRLFEKQTRN